MLQLIGVKTFAASSMLAIALCPVLMFGWVPKQDDDRSLTEFERLKKQVSELEGKLEIAYKAATKAQADLVTEKKRIDNNAIAINNNETAVKAENRRVTGSAEAINVLQRNLGAQIKRIDSIALDVSKHTDVIRSRNEIKLGNFHIVSNGNRASLDLREAGAIVFNIKGPNNQSAYTVMEFPAADDRNKARIVIARDTAGTTVLGSR